MKTPMVSPYLKRPVRSLDQVLAARAEILGSAPAEHPPKHLESAPELVPAPPRQPNMPDTLPASRRAA